MATLRLRRPRKNPSSVDEARVEISGPCRSVPERRTDPWGNRRSHASHRHVVNHSGPLGKTKGGKDRVFHPIFISAAPFVLALREPRCCLSRLLASSACANSCAARFTIQTTPEKISPTYSLVATLVRMFRPAQLCRSREVALRRQNHARVTHEADCRVKFGRSVPLLVERARLPRDLAGAIWMPVPGLSCRLCPPPIDRFHGAPRGCRLP